MCYAQDEFSEFISPKMMEGIEATMVWVFDPRDENWMHLDEVTARTNLFLAPCLFFLDEHAPELVMNIDHETGVKTWERRPTRGRPSYLF